MNSINDFLNKKYDDNLSKYFCKSNKVLSSLFSQKKKFFFAVQKILKFTNLSPFNDKSSYSIIVVGVQIQQSISQNFKIELLSVNGVDSVSLLIRSTFSIELASD